MERKAMATIDVYEKVLRNFPDRKIVGSEEIIFNLLLPLIEEASFTDIKEIIENVSTMLLLELARDKELDGIFDEIIQKIRDTARVAEDSHPTKYEQVLNILRFANYMKISPEDLLFLFKNTGDEKQACHNTTILLNKKLKDYKRKIILVDNIYSIITLE